MKNVLLLVFVAALAACSESPNTMRVSSTPATAEPREVFNAKNIVATKTAKPHEARFTDVKTYALGNGDRVYCGQMDAANAMGARTGMTPFYVRTSGAEVKSAHYKPESAEFASGKCSEAARGSIKISPH